MISKASQKCLIPPGFEHLQKELSNFKERFPRGDRNVFIMMPFSGGKCDAIYHAASDEVVAHGLIPLRADMHSFSQVLWWNIMTYMLGSTYGITIFQPSGRILFNPNVAIEAGFMQALDRPILLLANQRLKRLPVDFAGHIWKFFDDAMVKDSIGSAVKDWIERDLSYCAYGTRKMVLFVSLGGTCRCVMAKGILEGLLREHKISSVTVEAAAIAEPHATTVSANAIMVLKENECVFAKDHRPRKLCRFLQERADIIIALTDRPLSRTSINRKKAKTSEDIFGSSVPNPYPDEKNEKSRSRYRECFRIIERGLRESFQRILRFIGADPKL